MKKRFRFTAQFMYVVAIAWLSAAVGCFIQSNGLFGAIFSAMGFLHLVLAFVLDRKENNK